MLFGTVIWWAMRSDICECTVGVSARSALGRVLDDDFDESSTTTTDQALYTTTTSSTTKDVDLGSGPGSGSGGSCSGIFSETENCDYYIAISNNTFNCTYLESVYTTIT